MKTKDFIKLINELTATYTENMGAKAGEEACNIVAMKYVKKEYAYYFEQFDHEPDSWAYTICDGKDPIAKYITGEDVDE
ncbi:hypothetical protein [Helicobacter cinaedi]|uniref:Uncharacterized protein n=1 Tax=Helicobacter cinaedi CCUG 18818 = ATCC BAA-847 TaxID=537971 RepID=A0AAI8MQJ9_9HELI|nr:hypothetical protein [Helicobacter cinaedi]AWK62623.1 hypothetical protein C6B36_09930 [Helicobacter cinaedi]EFR46196.1 hypothetical protein HCCG_00742 [Helicobacter cinaedi CCUG 18818 = ATCC BAA-847]QOQ90573.1 hypothetical protein HW260_10205 [Helicobacter cinaedi]QOQ96742.1 hypothetical protein HW245_03555 [Helicobacter cinaedi]BAM33556.1 hypothetical protein HCBAA847_2341 [Helicobacter cinaedi CCUG 18818 = ATCC BAA-847]